LLIPGPARRPAAEAEPVRWGPDRPHPLSLMKTELVWEGKYDEYGRRRFVDVAGAAMPMQKIETVTHRGAKNWHQARQFWRDWPLPCGRTSGTGSSGATAAVSASLFTSQVP